MTGKASDSDIVVAHELAMNLNSSRFLKRVVNLPSLIKLLFSPLYDAEYLNMYSVPSSRLERSIVIVERLAYFKYDVSRTFEVKSFDLYNSNSTDNSFE